ncbi:Tetratricopeptide repeat-containing protein [Enhydrobacter aerosaccus]|uniref:Tetratricopeptide repeat-containing protein n=2 Tax=Enhydrobacter aerosaccus TaxID=225324 RepID=A0A1T4T8X9_9HYPH|nr:Tetratricopeptide repeat-containing protein [Enhydrobacter aerosaccus]
MLMLATGVLAQGTDSGNGRAAMLDTLFAKLQSTADPLAAQALEQAIWEQWTMVPDPGQRQLMLRGIAEMQQQELQNAIATFTKLIEIAPELSEAWNKRATVYWLVGNLSASIADICETVKREPRHFGAYSGLGMIRAQQGEPARAVAAFELARKYNPHIVGIDDEIARLKALAGNDVSDDPLGCGQRTAGR